MIYSVKNGTTELKINSLGAEVRSVVHKGRERAWQNETGEWSGCAILLFPFAGFNRLVFDGIDYGVQKHGFCRNEEFETVECWDDHIELLLRSNERTRTIYPYSFEFFVRYTLTGGGYEITYRIKNTGDRILPFACGGHEAFALEDEVCEYYVEFEREETFDPLLHDSNGFLTGERGALGGGRVLELEREFTDGSVTVILDNINSGRATLRKKGTGERIVEIGFEGFSNLLLWHPHGSKMLCLEPWQCLPSYVNEIREFGDRDGVVSLLPGHEIAFTRTITY